MLATGGIGRGYSDDYSDLDLIVYADHKKVKENRKYIAVVFLRYKNIKLDTPVESYEKALNQKSPSEILGKPEMFAYQASERGGKLKVKVLPNSRVNLIGQATIVSKGELFL